MPDGLGEDDPAGRSYQEKNLAFAEPGRESFCSAATSVDVLLKYDDRK